MRVKKGHQYLTKGGNRAAALVLLACILPGLHAEPRNAPDVRGKFTLIVGGHGRYTLSGEDLIEPREGPYNIPLTVIPGFDSFYRCRAAGMELQARFNTDGYTLDFVCALTGK